MREWEEYHYGSGDFSSLPQIQPRVLAALEKSNLVRLRHCQCAAFSSIHNGEDVILKSPTGTGKTLAYAIPLISRLLDMPMRKLEPALNETFSSETYWRHQIRCIILTPSKELARQIVKVLQLLTLTSTDKLIPFAINEPPKTAKKLAHEVTGNILVVQPSTLCKISNILRNNLPGVSVLYPNCTSIVIDEADLVMGTYGYDKETEQVFRRTEGETGGLFHLHQAASSRVQVVLVSATINSDIQALSIMALYKPTVVCVDFAGSPHDSFDAWGDHAILAESSFIHCEIPSGCRKLIDHRYLKVTLKTHSDLIAIYGAISTRAFAPDKTNNRVIIFTNNTYQLARIAISLRLLNVSVAVVCGLQALETRMTAIRKFNAGQITVLITVDAGLLDANDIVHKSKKKAKLDKTSALSRGIDFIKVNLIVLHGVPPSLLDYTHRVGRCGRDIQTTDVPTCLTLLHENCEYMSVWSEICSEYPVTEPECCSLDSFSKLAYRVRDCAGKASKHAIKEFIEQLSASHTNAV